jgi:hypothetical protein
MRLADLVDRHHPLHRLKTYLGLELQHMHIAIIRFSYGFPNSLDGIQHKQLS